MYGCGKAALPRITETRQCNLAGGIRNIYSFHVTCPSKQRGEERDKDLLRKGFYNRVIGHFCSALRPHSALLPGLALGSEAIIFVLNYFLLQPRLFAQYDQHQSLFSMPTHQSRHHCCDRNQPTTPTTPNRMAEWIRPAAFMRAMRTHHPLPAAWNKRTNGYAPAALQPVC